MSSRCVTTEVTLASKLVVVTFVMEVPLAKISIVGIKILFDRHNTIFRSCISSSLFRVIFN